MMNLNEHRPTLHFRDSPNRWIFIFKFNFGLINHIHTHPLLCSIIIPATHLVIQNRIHSKKLNVVRIIPSNHGYTTSHRDAALLWPAQGHLRRNVKKNTTPNPTGDCPVVPHLLKHINNWN